MSSQVEDQTSSAAADSTAAQSQEDCTSKEFQEKYYPLSASPVNKYDPYSLQTAIDTELISVSLTSHFALC